jgi:hypothetical protein
MSFQCVAETEMQHGLPERLLSLTGAMDANSLGGQHYARLWIVVYNVK